MSDEHGQNEIIIEPFEVVIIQTYERLNMPEFMIARWNVAVGKAYEGLLWVGAAQVDPGFQGYLCCPIYNLSDKPVFLKFRESIAVIDFVTTTPPNDESRKFRFDALRRKRILFEDYRADRLESALTTQAKDRLDKVESNITELRGIVFTSIGVILAALGALVTALALFLSNAVPNTSRFSPSLLVSMAAIFMSLVALIMTLSKSPIRRPALFLIVILVLGMGAFLWWYAGMYPLPAVQPKAAGRGLVACRSRPEELRQQAVPAPVIIDEALELARQFSSDESISFINGILDAVHRQTLAAGG